MQVVEVAGGEGGDQLGGLAGAGFHADAAVLDAQRGGLEGGARGLLLAAGGEAGEAAEAEGERVRVAPGLLGGAADGRGVLAVGREAVDAGEPAVGDAAGAAERSLARAAPARPGSAGPGRGARSSRRPS